MVNKSHYQAHPGIFRWIYKGLFQAPDIDNRFFIDQWMKGSVQGCGKGGKKCKFPSKIKHHDKAKVSFNFPEWVVDVPTVKSTEYVGLTKRGNKIGFSDAPGVGQSVEEAKENRWPSGSVWKADMEFLIQVYSKDSLKGTTVADFASIEDPKPVKTVKWSWKDSYTIP